MSTTTRSLIANEFLRLRLEGPAELVRGDLIETDAPDLQHGLVCGQVAFLLKSFARQHKLEYVVTNDAGIVTERNPDTVRSGDVWFLKRDRVEPADLANRGYLDVVPDLVVEVHSPSNRCAEMAQRVGESLNAGVEIVCVIEPDKRSAHLYFQESSDHLTNADGIVELPEVLPGFRARVSEFFHF